MVLHADTRQVSHTQPRLVIIVSLSVRADPNPPPLQNADFQSFSHVAPQP